jgi:nitroreductase
MLSAEARGLGTCAQGAVAIWSNAVRREFNVPKGYKLIYGIAVGHPSNATVNDFQAERLPAGDITIEKKS